MSMIKWKVIKMLVDNKDEYKNIDKEFHIGDKFNIHNVLDKVVMNQFNISSIDDLDKFMENHRIRIVVDLVDVDNKENEFRFVFYNNGNIWLLDECSSLDKDIEDKIYGIYDDFEYMRKELLKIVDESMSDIINTVKDLFYLNRQSYDHIPEIENDNEDIKNIIIKHIVPMFLNKNTFEYEWLKNHLLYREYTKLYEYLKHNSQLMRSYYNEHKHYSYYAKEWVVHYISRDFFDWFNENINKKEKELV